MPCYNAEKHLRTSLASVAEQTYRDFELIAVNDGSLDDTAAILSDFATQYSWLTVVDQENRGLPAARNRGLSHARGEYVAFLDSDDTWSPQFLEEMTQSLESNPECILAYCGWQNIGLQEGRNQPFVPPDYENDGKLESLLTGCRWPVHATLTRKFAIEEVGGFDEELKSCEDYDLWLKIAPFKQITRVPKVLAYYHHHEGQMSGNSQRMALYNFHVQKRFILNNPEIEKTLGKRRAIALVAEELNYKALNAHWQGDSKTARILFRTLAREGYFTPTNAKYLFASLLPLSLYLRLAPAASKTGIQGG